MWPRPVLSACTAQGPGGGDVLVCGGVSELSVWRWSDLVAGLEDGLDEDASTPHARMHLDQAPGHAPHLSGSVECNMLAGDAGASVVVAGSDGVLYACDVESESVVRALAGHADYVHCVSWAAKGATFCSGGEDGVVCLWDLRAGGRPARRVDLHETLVRSGDAQVAAALRDKKSFVSGVQVQAEGGMAMCGGGADTGNLMSTKMPGWLCELHLGSGLLVTSTRAPSAVQEMAITAHGELAVGGPEAGITYWSAPGLSQISKVQVSAKSVFAIKPLPSRDALQPMATAVAGSSYLVDIFVERGFCARSLVPPAVAVR